MAKSRLMEAKKRKKKCSKKRSQSRTAQTKAPATQLKRLIKTATDQELADGVLRILLGIETLKRCEKRRDNLRSKAEELGDVSGTGKRCSQNHRCGNLGCPICRRRTQLATIIAYAPYLLPRANTGSRI